MYEDGIEDGKIIGADQEKENISYGITEFSEGTDDYYHIYVYMTDGERIKAGWVNTGIPVPQDPGPSGEGDTNQAWELGHSAGLDFNNYFGNDFQAAWDYAYAEAVKNGYSNAEAMADAFKAGYIAGYNT